MDRRVTSAAVVVLMAGLLTACDSGSDATGDTSSSDVPTTSTAPAEPTIPGPPSPPVLIAGAANDIELAAWSVSPGHEALVYAGSDATRGIFVRGVDVDGESWTIIPGPLNDPVLAFDATGKTLLVVHRMRGDGSEPGYRLLAVPVAGGAVQPIAGSRNPIVVGDTAGDEVVFAVEAPRRTIFYAHDTDLGENRELGELSNRDGGVLQLIVVDGHAIVVYDSGRDTSVMSLPLQGGDAVELPGAIKSTSFVLHGGTPDGLVVISQTGDGEDSIYLVDPSGEGVAPRVLADDARPRSIRRDGDTILYRDIHYREMRIALDSGEVAEAAGDNPAPPLLDVVIPRLDMSTVTLVELLSDGRWLLTGAEDEGLEVVYWWETLHDGAREFRTEKLRYLFLYDPRSLELTRLSGPPEVRTITTLTGTGSPPDRIRRVEVLGDGAHVAYSTGGGGGIPTAAEYTLSLVAIPPAD